MAIATGCSRAGLLAVEAAARQRCGVGQYGPVLQGSGAAGLWGSSTAADLTAHDLGGQEASRGAMG